jgi:hypothetical protein
MNVSMEVMMFVCNNPQQAEKEVGQWLAHNPVTITHITQSQSERGGAFVFVLSLFYSRNSVPVASVQETAAHLSFR